MSKRIRDHQIQAARDWSGVPKDLIPEIETAWREQYWWKLKAYLAEAE